MAVLLIESPNALYWCLDCLYAAPLPRQSRAKWRLLVLDAVLTRSSQFNWTAPYKRRRLSTLGLCALREAPMERFVHNEYLIHLRKQLAGTTDEAKRLQTSTLLTEEEVKDHLPPKEK